MRPALLAALGAIAIGTASAVDAPTVPAVDASPRPEARVRRGTPISCAQGPLRVTEMELMDGYLKARTGKPATRHHEFYFARSMYSEGGRYGIFGYGGDYLGDGTGTSRARPVAVHD